MRFFIPAVPLKVKLVGKYVFKNTSKQAFITNFQFSLRPKNEFGALVAFKLYTASNTLENGGRDLSASLIQMDNLIDPSSIDSTDS